MKNFVVIIICFSISAFGCKQKSKVEIESEMVMVTTLDSIALVQEYIEKIRSFPEFQSWAYNSNASNGKETKGFYHFESRVLAIGKNKFYHIELFKTQTVLPTDSYIPPAEIVAYFRVDTYNHSIKILDTTSNTFLDFKSTEGKECFKKCLLLL